MKIYEVIIARDEMSTGERVLTDSPEYVINERLREMENEQRQQEWSSGIVKDIYRSFSVRLVSSSNVQIKGKEDS